MSGEGCAVPGCGGELRSGLVWGGQGCLGAGGAVGCRSVGHVQASAGRGDRSVHGLRAESRDGAAAGCGQQAVGR